MGTGAIAVDADYELVGDNDTVIEENDWIANNETVIEQNNLPGNNETDMGEHELIGNNETIFEKASPKYTICDLCRCDEPENLPLQLDCSSLDLKKVPETLEDIRSNITITLDFSNN